MEAPEEGSTTSIVLMTDGEQNGGQSYAQLKKKYEADYRALGVPLYVVLVGDTAAFRAMDSEPLPGPGDNTSPKPLGPHGLGGSPIYTLTGEVLGELKARGLLHEPDGDLERVARLVAQPDADSQFLKFYMAGPELPQAIPGQAQSQEREQTADHAVEVETHDLKITMHISSRGMREDFAELEHKENAAVIGALRRLDADNKTATVRVIVVY